MNATDDWRHEVACLIEQAKQKSLGDLDYERAARWRDVDGMFRNQGKPALQHASPASHKASADQLAILQQVAAKHEDGSLTASVLMEAADQYAAPASVEGRGPPIVCLCGSGRFREAFDNAEFDETLAGKIVLTIGCNTKDIARTPDLEHHKPMLDELHLRKIDLADEVLILNVGGYIGQSTRRELEYAQSNGKRIRFLEEPTNAQ